MQFIYNSMRNIEKGLLVGLQDPDPRSIYSLLSSNFAPKLLTSLHDKWLPAKVLDKLVLNLSSLVVFTYYSGWTLVVLVEL